SIHGRFVPCCRAPSRMPSLVFLSRNSYTAPASRRRRRALRWSVRAMETLVRADSVPFLLRPPYSLRQKRCDDRVPFVLECTHRDRFARFLIPIPRIRLIVFHTVKVSMHPGCVSTIIVHDDRMSALPIAFLEPPQ